MFVTITTFLVLIPVLLVIRQIYLYIWYHYKSRKLGVGVPTIVDYQWLGFPATYHQITQAKNNTLCTYLSDLNTARGGTNVLINNFSGLNIGTGDPENIKAIQSTQFKDFDLGNRHSQLKPLLGEDGIFTLSGDGWYHSRAMLRPQFTKDRVVDQLNLMEQHVEKLLQLFENKSKDGQIFDVQEIFQSYTTELTLQFLFDEDIDCVNENPKASEFQAAMDRAQQFLIIRSQAGILYPLVDSKNLRKDCKTCHDFIDDLVERAIIKRDKREKNKQTEYYVFINELLKETENKLLVRDQCTSVMLAGRDTTAALLSFSCYLLARHKTIFDRLKQTVLEAFGTDKNALTYDSLRQCEYLKNFLNEVLRYYTPVPLNFRQATKDTTLPRGGSNNDNGPIFVPKGAQIFFSSWVMQRDKDLWGEDADQFNPDRWTRQNYPQHSWSYFAFNGGPRVCIGQALALTEASYTIVRLMQEFDSIYTSVAEMGTDFEQQIGLVLKCKRGVNVAFK